MDKQNTIPPFKTIAEEARFWDTHDVVDFLDVMERTDVEFVPQQKKAETVTIRIEPKLKKHLERVARASGVNLSGLVRMWILEKLRSPQAAH